MTEYLQEINYQFKAVHDIADKGLKAVTLEAGAKRTYHEFQKKGKYLITSSAGGNEKNKGPNQHIREK